MLVETIQAYLSASKLTKPERDDLRYDVRFYHPCERLTFNCDSHEALVSLLKTPSMIQAVKLCIGPLHNAIATQGLWKSDTSILRNSMGSFMAAYIIENHAARVFDSIGPKEDALTHAAQKMLAEFDAITVRGDLSFYADALEKYITLFRVWKAQDQIRLRDQVIMSLRGIASALTEIVGVERIQLLTQAGILRDRLSRIGCSDALEDFDAAYPWLAPEAQAAAASDFAMFGLDPMSNDQLSHEILLDPNYRLPIEAPNQALQAAVWVGVEEDLRQTPPYLGRVLRILRQIRDGVAAVSPPATAVALHDLIDEQFIRHRAEQGLFGWKQCTTLIYNIAAVINQRQPFPELDGVDPPAQLRNGIQFLLSLANTVRVEEGNRRLRRLIPSILMHGAKYERDRFQAKLESGAVGLEKTRAWLSQTTPSVAIAKLASEYDGTNCPETLLLDIVRLRALAIEFRRSVLLGKTILALRKCIPARSLVIAQITQALLRTTDEGDIVPCVVSIAGEKARAAVESSLASKNDAIEKLLRARLLEIWQQAAAGRMEDVLTLGSGLEELSPTIRRSARIIRQMAAVNMEVHGELYERIIKEG